MEGYYMAKTFKDVRTFLQENPTTRIKYRSGYLHPLVHSDEPVGYAVFFEKEETERVGILFEKETKRVVIHHRPRETKPQLGFSFPIEGNLEKLKTCIPKEDAERAIQMLQEIDW